MNNASGLSGAVLARVEEAEALRSLQVAARMELNRALLAGVCPSCGGELKERTGLWRFFFSGGTPYDCIGCGMRHVLSLED